MAEPCLGNRTTEKPSPLNRRKIRRGTQSCWECKRRKTRCTFASPNSSVCDGCRSRKVNCISQQFENGLETVDKGEEARDWGRTENVIERLSPSNGNGSRNSELHVGKDTNRKTAVSALYCLDSI